ncbi:MAG: GTPase HflX [Candidatus Lokiarchaeota archaeon]|nr:GTPase HflX [Candidatus Lokiarchaeota archaeon]
MNKKAILVMLKTNIHDHKRFKVCMNELRKLAQALNYIVIDQIVQTKKRPKSNYLIGEGKVKEIQKMVKDLDIAKIIFYNILKSKQKYNISSTTECSVADRYDLILEIFDIMARDKLSKLQIEKARLIKNLPLIKLRASKRLKVEHPGARGRGEYAYKSKISGVQSKISKIDEEIEKHKRIKEKWLEKRRNLDMPIVCLTGNYNAGKTTLFNLLTDSEKPVSDTPFTTLTSKYQRLSDRDILFVDTIGFVIDIDPKLIGSFELNLFDMKNADVILYLLDASDMFYEMKLKFLTGINILLDIEIDHKKIIIVLTKSDLVDMEDLKTKEDKIREFFPYKFPQVSISAKESKNVNELFKKIQYILLLQDSTNQF